jgi:ethanolamine ammonia-lyase small subunit
MEEIVPRHLHELRAACERFTPARVFTGRAGPAYHTADLLRLRSDHAQARDAVDAPFHPETLLDEKSRAEWNPLIVSTLAATREEYLVRPDRGRRFDEASVTAIRGRGLHPPVIQLAIGDGLSVAAVEQQVPRVLAPLRTLILDRGWSSGPLLIARNCRVGILNHIGELIRPEVAVLLIGERPGLAVANSLGAYMAYRPDASHTDANRNVISNIHERGIAPNEAALRIVKLAEEMRGRNLSGVEVKEPALTAQDRARLNF